jgi:UDP-N-acetylmuramyl tripeptide synthase
MSRALRRGKGAAIGGKVALALAPGLLDELSRGRRVSLVSGTNGKTTTTRLLAEAVAATSSVTTSRGGNLPQTMVGPLRRPASDAVLEVDELWLGPIADQLHPQLVVLMNLSRDQLDRMNEVRRVATGWRHFLATRTGPCTVVASADDPSVVWAVGDHQPVVWVGTGTLWEEDAVLCPSCGHARQRYDPCSCGFRLPPARWQFDDRTAMDVSTGVRVPFAMGLPGRFNRANGLLALAAAVELGVDTAMAAVAIGSVNSVEHRYETVSVGSHDVRLLLGKNPASWAELLAMVEGGDEPVIVCLNADVADGSDTSWIWDVPFERLAGRQVVASGRRAADLALRLTVARVDPIVARDPLAALRLLPPGNVELVATYTAFHEVIDRLASLSRSDPTSAEDWVTPLPAARTVGVVSSPRSPRRHQQNSRSMTTSTRRNSPSKRDRSPSRRA